MIEVKRAIGFDETIKEKISKIWVDGFGKHNIR
jgi:hypothetical protein